MVSDGKEKMCDFERSAVFAHLPKTDSVNTIVINDRIFGALKLIEHLVQVGEVPAHVFRNILLEYGEQINPADFQCPSQDDG